MSVEQWVEKQGKTLVVMVNGQRWFGIGDLMHICLGGGEVVPPPSSPTVKDDNGLRCLPLFVSNTCQRLPGHITCGECCRGLPSMGAWVEHPSYHSTHPCVPM